MNLFEDSEIPNFPRDHRFKYLGIKQNINKGSFLDDETCLMACQANTNKCKRKRERAHTLCMFSCIMNVSCKR